MSGEKMDKRRQSMNGWQFLAKTLLFLCACTVLMATTKTGPFRVRIEDNIKHVSESCRYEINRANELNN